MDTELCLLTKRSVMFSEAVRGLCCLHLQLRKHKHIDLCISENSSGAQDLQWLARCLTHQNTLPMNLVSTQSQFLHKYIPILNLKETY